MTLPVYVINLDRRADRLASIAANLNCVGLPFERIPAIDAQSLPAVGMKPLVSLGARACLLSHAEALRRFLDTSHPAAAIFEDDAEVAADLPAHCVSIDWWPAGTALVKLDTPNNLKNLQGWLCGQTPSGRDLRQIVRWNAGAAAYLVNRAGGTALLETIEKEELNIDRTMFDPRFSSLARQLRPVQIVPAAVRQNPVFGSDINHWTQPSQRRRKKRRMLIKRSVRWQMRLVWWWMTGKARRMWVRYSEAPVSD